MESVTLRCTTGGHFKEYCIELDDTTVIVSWGKIGAAKQQRRKTFRSSFAAREFAKSKEWEKLEKGYVFHVPWHMVGNENIPADFLADIEMMRQVEAS